MKESGMEKLIELLNQFEKEKKSGYTWRSIDSYDNCVYGVDCDGETEITMYSDLYSKYYGFIKWLVENNKINKREIDTRLVRYVENHYDEEGYRVESSYENYSDTNTLIMLLSISDTPIEDLIDYLR